MKEFKLTKEEQEIEDMLQKGELKSTSKAEFKRIKKILDDYKRDAVLNIRINSNDLKLLKSKAKKLGVKYQSFISEILHKIAHS